MIVICKEVVLNLENWTRIEKLDRADSLDPIKHYDLVIHYIAGHNQIVTFDSQEERDKEHNKILNLLVKDKYCAGTCAPVRPGGEKVEKRG